MIAVGNTTNALAQAPKGEEGKWTFVGQLTNDADTLWLLPTDNLKEVNELVRTDGAFRFTTDLAQPKEYIVVTPSLVRNEPIGFSFIITAVPGEVVVAEGRCDNQQPANGLRYSGSPFYELYAEATAAGQKVMESKDAQAAIDFVKAHRESESTAIVVGAVGCYAPDRTEELLALLSPSVRNGRLKGYIDQQVADAKEYVRQQELQDQTLPVGSEAPNFTLNDLDGKPLSLSSLRGKYVVLDFWGSWCGWCIKGFPEMKTYYEKYKDKMEILGVDCNDTEAKWKKAVADNALPWKHVYVPRGSSVPSDYLITGFPTKIIISPEGKVVHTIIGEDPQFYKLLDALFQAN